MSDLQSVPEIWKTMCDDIDHPLAIFDRDNHFVWVNGAYERLLGYSITELTGRTWMSITEQKDVGGNLASIQAVVDGEIQSYRMELDFKHRRGFAVQVEQTVRRFPVSAVEELVFFRVESPPAKATRPDLEQVASSLRQEISDIRRMVESGGVNVNLGDKIGGDKVGRDKNSDSAIKFMGGVMVAMVITIAWLFYYVATTAVHTVPNKPEIVAPQNN